MSKECLGLEGFFSHCKLTGYDEYWGKMGNL